MKIVNMQEETKKKKVQDIEIGESFIINRTLYVKVDKGISTFPYQYKDYGTVLNLETNVVTTMSNHTEVQPVKAEIRVL